MKTKSVTSSDSNSDDSRWSKKLPDELIIRIMKRLCLADSMRLQAVSPHWRAAAANAISEKWFHPAPELPWLLVGVNPLKNWTFTFLSLSEERIYKPKPSQGRLEDFYELHCIGSIEGWLVMVGKFKLGEKVNCGCLQFTEQTSNFFLNPLSGATVMLPSQSTISYKSKPESLRKVIFSSSPTGPNCIVAAVTLGGNLVFCRPFDKTWTLFKRHERYHFKDIAFLEDGKLYALAKKSAKFIFIFDPLKVLCEDQGNTYRGEKLSLLHTVPVLEISNHQREARHLIVFNSEFPYLVKSSRGELLLLLRRVDACYCYDKIHPDIIESSITTTKGFRVFKLDQNGHQWVQLKNLENQILFVSDRNNEFMSQIAIPATDKALRSKNCIYFSFWTELQMGCFCLDTGKVIHLRSNVSYLKVQHGTAWFTPNPW